MNIETFILYFCRIKNPIYKHSTCIWDSYYLINILYTIPCAFIASATFKKPAIFAPAT